MKSPSTCLSGFNIILAYLSTDIFWWISHLSHIVTSWSGGAMIRVCTCCQRALSYWLKSCARDQTKDCSGPRWCHGKLELNHLTISDVARLPAGQCSRMWSILATASHQVHCLRAGFFLTWEIKSGVAKSLCSILNEQSLSLEILHHRTILLKTRQQSVVDKGEICNLSSHFVRVGANQFSFLSNVFVLLINSFGKHLSVVGQPSWCLNLFCKDTDNKNTDYLEPCWHEASCNIL